MQITGWAHCQCQDAFFNSSCLSKDSWELSQWRAQVSLFLALGLFFFQYPIRTLMVCYNLGNQSVFKNQFSASSLPNFCVMVMMTAKLILLSSSSPFLHWPTICLQNDYCIRYILHQFLQVSIYGSDIWYSNSHSWFVKQVPGLLVPPRGRTSLERTFSVASQFLGFSNLTIIKMVSPIDRGKIYISLFSKGMQILLKQ